MGRSGRTRPQFDRSSAPSDFLARFKFHFHSKSQFNFKSNHSSAARDAHHLFDLTIKSNRLVPRTNPLDKSKPARVDRLPSDPDRLDPRDGPPDRALPLKSANPEPVALRTGLQFRQLRYRPVSIYFYPRLWNPHRRCVVACNRGRAKGLPPFRTWLFIFVEENNRQDVHQCCDTE